MKQEKLPRAYWGLVVAQFFGAVNDNAFKFIVTLIVINSEDSTSITFLCLTQLFFALPYFFFSYQSGDLADYFRKSEVIRAMKYLELMVMILGLVCLMIGTKIGLVILVFCMGAQSSFFSPSKYGILPELLKESDLSRANAYLEALTFLAVIIGTIIAPVIKGYAGESSLVIGSTIVMISVLGILASYFVKEREDLLHHKMLPFSLSRCLSILFSNPFRRMRETVREIGDDVNIFWMIFGIGFFWFAGSYVYLNLIWLLKSSVPAQDFEATMAVFMAILVVGIGSGSIFAGIVSHSKVELGLVPIGLFLMTIASAFMGLFGYSYYGHLALSLLLGYAAGLIVVPLQAYLQANALEEHRGKIIAISNVVSMGIAVSLSSVVLWVLLALLGASSYLAFGFLALLSAGVLIIACKKLPQMLLRCVNWLLSNTFYRLKVVGLENLPKEGGALIVCNHVTWVDAALLMAASPRPVRFLMFRPVYEMPFVKPFATIAGAIPIEGGSSAEKRDQALRLAREALERGEVVGIFAEGALSRLGRVVGFKKGFEYLMRGVEVPIIPAYLDQLWGSVFSYEGGKFFWKLPKELPYPVTLGFGEPLPPQSKHFVVRQAVTELSSRVFTERKRVNSLLHVGFLRAARRSPLKTVVINGQGEEKTYLDLFFEIQAFRAELRKLNLAGQRVGIVSTDASLGVVANLACLFEGAVPMNLPENNEDLVVSKASHFGLRLVITTSSKFESAERLQNVSLIEMEKLELVLSPQEKALNCLYLAFSSIPLIEKLLFKRTPVKSEVAAIVCIEGQGEELSGVELTHQNIAANLEALFDILKLDKKDIVLGVTPISLGFGLVTNLWLPLLAGIKVSYPGLNEGIKRVEQHASKWEATVLFSTPEQLKNYVEKVNKENFSFLRLVLVGLENVSTELCQRFQEKFGVRVLEGYERPELSGFAVLNLVDFEAVSPQQVGNKADTVGHPIPGVAVKVVDIETGKSLPPGAEGRLLVKSPSLMRGIVGLEGKELEATKNGWFETGDIASIDTEGFVSVVDSSSRFSRICGEMVSHRRIEEEIVKLWSETFSEEVQKPEVALKARQAKSSEELVVYHTLELDPHLVVKELQQRGLPQLWIPKRENFIRVDSLPKLTSGRIDYRNLG